MAAWLACGRLVGGLGARVFAKVLRQYQAVDHALLSGLCIGAVVAPQIVRQMRWSVLGGVCSACISRQAFGSMHALLEGGKLNLAQGLL